MPVRPLNTTLSQAVQATPSVTDETRSHHDAMATWGTRLSGALTLPLHRCVRHGKDGAAAQLGEQPANALQGVRVAGRWSSGRRSLANRRAAEGCFAHLA